MSILKDQNGILILLIAVVLTLLLRAFIINLTKIPLTKIVLEESDTDIVTIWLENGVVVKSDKDDDYWKDQIVINPDTLNVGNQLIMYDLSVDAVRRKSYLVLKVEKNSW